jgi:hypothetical protein
MSIRDIKYLDRLSTVIVIFQVIISFHPSSFRETFGAGRPDNLTFFLQILFFPFITDFKMQYTSTVLCAVLAVTPVFSHGVITEVKGANGKSPYSTPSRSELTPTKA